MRCMEKRKSGEVIRIVVSPPFFTPVVDDTPLRVVLPVNSCCPIEGTRSNILHALYWLRKGTDTNTIGAVEQDQYRLEDQQGAIVSSACFNYLSGMTVKLITSDSCVSAPPTPPPTPAPPRASSPDPHPPPPFVTTTGIPVIIVDQESLLRIGGYGSGRVSIVTVAKAASEYLGGGHFVWKEEAKTLLDRAKKAARDCINGMDDTNRGSYRPGTMRQLQLVINLLEQVEYRGLRGKLLTFTSPRNGSDYYTISILSEEPINNLPIIDYRIPRGEWHQGSDLLKFHVGEDGKMASEDDGELILEDDGELISEDDGELISEDDLRE